jgi:hypothetical protein
MRKKISPLEQSRRRVGEDLFVSDDTKSMHRGQRVAPRTEVCRPCLVWTTDASEEKKQGVILDLNPYGLKVRMLDTFEPGTEVEVQMMRDDEFRVALSRPIRAKVVRVAPNSEGFLDYGLKVWLEKVERPTVGPVTRVETAAPRRRSTASRMYTMDYSVDDAGVRRTGRNRG